MNTPFRWLLYYHKELINFLWRVIIIQDFKTVILSIALVYKQTFSALFCWMKVCAFQAMQFNSQIHFHSQIYQSGKGVYWNEDKQHEICFDFANFEVSKIYHYTAAKKNESAIGGGGEHISTILFQRHFTRVSLISCFMQKYKAILIQQVYKIKYAEGLWKASLVRTIVLNQNVSVSAFSVPVNSSSLQVCKSQVIVYVMHNFEKNACK